MIRTMARVVPLVVLAAIAMAPWLVVAAFAGVAADLPHARLQLGLGYLLAATAWIGQLWLVAAAAPLQRDAGPLEASRNLARAIAPWAIAVAAIVLGFAALVVPGLVMLVLFAPTGASTRLGEPPPAPLDDAARAARASFRRLAIIVGALVVANFAVAFVAHHLVIAEMAAKPTAEQLHTTRTYVRIVALALAALAPAPAWLVARAYRGA